jgi:hypothetical protein
LREWLVFQLQGSTDDDAPAAFFRIPSARSEKIEFTEWAYPSGLTALPA